MSKDKISDYSATANSNTDIGGINIDEGCAPSGINDAIRTLMKQLKDWQSGSQDVYIHPAGSASAPSITATGDTNTGIFFPAADTVGITTGGTERARVDSSGNLGLGVTPSAWNASIKVLEMPDSGFFAFANTNGNISTNTFFDTGYKYKASAAAARYSQSSGQHIWYNAASGTAGNAITFTQAMTLDASGNLGVGNTSPSYRLDITAAASNNGVAAVRAGSGYTSYVSIAGNGTTPLSTSFDLIQDSTNAYIYQRANAPMVFGTNNTERARIDSSGNLLVGTTTANFNFSSGWNMLINSGASYTNTAHASGTSSGAGYANFIYNSGVIGSITQSGTTAVAYNTSSDYRLKENIAPMTGALAKVAALKPCTYNWKTDGSDGEGFIAHELAEVCPHAVTGEKDAVDEQGNPKYQGIDTSFLVATLTAALQEAHGLIKDLQTRVAALES